MRVRRVILLLAAVWLLGGQAWAAEIPREVLEAAPEVSGFLSEEPEEGFGLVQGVKEIVSDAIREWKSAIFAGIRSTAAIMAGVILLGAVESAAPVGRETLTKYSSVVGALWITAMASGDLNALIGLGRETISEIGVLTKTFLPALAAAEAASGGVSAAAARQVAAVFFANVLLSVIEGVLLPAVYLYIGTAAAGAVVEGEALERIGELLKKGIGWVLGGLLTLFMMYLTISGAIAGSADAHAVKVAKTAVSAAVPVVGGILSEAVESVLAGAGVLRGMIGTLGTLALLGACVTPFLRLGTQYLFYQAASLVSAAAGPAKLTKLIAMLGDAFMLVLAMTGAAAVLMLVSVLSSVAAVAPG